MVSAGGCTLCTATHTKKQSLFFCRCSEASKRDSEKSIQQCKEFAAKNGVDVSKFTNFPPKDALDAFPGLGVLTERSWTVLQAAGVTADGLPEPSPGRVIDCSQNNKVMSPHEGKTAPVITPTGVFFLTSRVRKILGLEALRLQGFLLDNSYDEQLQSFPDSLLHDLAGNAFSVHCVMAMMLVSIVLISRHVRGDIKQLVGGHVLTALKATPMLSANSTHFVDWAGGQFRERWGFPSELQFEGNSVFIFLPCARRAVFDGFLKAVPSQRCICHFRFEESLGVFLTP